MLLLKLQAKITKFNDNHSIKKLEKLIIKVLYKSNIGPEHSGLADYQLKSTGNINKFISSDTAFCKAMSNLKFAHLIEYSSNDNLFFSNIKLTNTGIDFYIQKNQIHLKPTVITTAIATIFSVIATLTVDYIQSLFE